MPSNLPTFLVTVCQIGAEPALKQEIGRDYPDLRPAFARPGLITFKSVGAPLAAEFELRSVFARAYAVALGPANDAQEVLALADAARAGKPLRLHVWERDASRPREESAPGGPAVSEEARLSNVRTALLKAEEGRFLEGERAREGDLVLDVIVAEGEPMFVGVHRHSALHSAYPGGRIAVVVPEEAPSRAYRKLEEALAWSGAPMRRGQIAVEIGSAPGGASYALLRRGLEVVGVDPGEMSPVVMNSPHYRHLATSIADVRLADLPPQTDWLLLDVNLAPQVALHAVRGLVASLRPSLRGVLFTLKLNDWAMAAKVPDLVRRVAAMGMQNVRATQLPSNRQEICVYGVFEKAAAVKKRPPST